MSEPSPLDKWVSKVWPDWMLYSGTCPVCGGECDWFCSASIESERRAVICSACGVVMSWLPRDAGVTARGTLDTGLVSRQHGLTA